VTPTFRVADLHGNPEHHPLKYKNRHQPANENLCSVAENFNIDNFPKTKSKAWRATGIHGITIQ